MANVTRATGSHQNTSIFRWQLTDEAPTGDPLSAGDTDLSDRSVQVYGDLGGGTVEWQGTSDPALANWHVLSTTGGAAATFVAAGIKQILESTLYARPVLVGAGNADCSVVLVGRKPSRS